MPSLELPTGKQVCRGWPKPFSLPRTADEVLGLARTGKLSPAEAFAIFRSLDRDRRAPSQLRVAVAGKPAKSRDPEEARRAAPASKPWRTSTP